MVDSRSDFDILRSHLEIHANDHLYLNGQEMILLPRHFFRYILREVQAVAGTEAFRRIFEKAGHDGAVTFCRRFREVHGCTPEEAVRGYLKEMSLRGWGRFSILRLEPERGYLDVLLQNSALAAEGELPSGHIIWEASMAGALGFLRDCMGKPFDKPPTARSEELPSANKVGEGCRIIVGPEPV
ncbi:MAG TPA: DUF5943 domain-containing protein [Acidobacteriota bacterium]